LRFRFAFTQADARKFRIGKQTVWNLPASGDAIASGKIGMDHAEIVNAVVCKLRATSDFADCPNARRCGLQALIDLDVSTGGQLDAG